MHCRCESVCGWCTLCKFPSPPLPDFDPFSPEYTHTLVCLSSQLCCFFCNSLPCFPLLAFPVLVIWFGGGNGVVFPSPCPHGSPSGFDDNDTDLFFCFLSLFLSLLSLLGEARMGVLQQGKESVDLNLQLHLFTHSDCAQGKPPVCRHIITHPPSELEGWRNSSNQRKKNIHYEVVPLGPAPEPDGPAPPLLLTPASGPIPNA